MDQTRPWLVVIALLVGTFLAALDLNVVGTALPSVVGDLGGLQLYGLVVAAYLLTSTTTIPLYGRLADLYGRKALYLVATLLFLIGSALCGAAWSMLALVIFRAVQGLGAGGIVPITITLFGDLFPGERRAFVQGLFSMVWGVSSVLGPLLGGFLVSFVSWRWVFWLNLPIGLAATLLLVAALHEEISSEERPRLDLAGAAVLAAGLLCLLVGVQSLRGSANPWVGVGLIGGAALLAALLVRIERRASAPLLPVELFRNRAVLITALGGLALGGVLISCVTYVPMYVQGVHHGTPTQAGLALVPLSVAWTACTFATGPLARAFGYRPVVLVGSVSCLAGVASLMRLPEGGPILELYAPMVLVGAGMGLTITATTIAVQDEMEWRQRGVATALIQFTRTVGGMVAVTLVGSLITSWFAADVGPRLPRSLSPAELLDPDRWSQLPPRTTALARDALGAAARRGFLIVTGLAAVVLLVHLGFPALRM